MPVQVNGEGPPSAIAAALVGVNSNLMPGRNTEAGSSNGFGGSSAFPELDGKEFSAQVC